MPCRLRSRITAVLLLATTLSISLPTHGSVFDRNQSVQVERNLHKGSKPKERLEGNLEITEPHLNAASRETPSRWFSQARQSVPDETKKSSLGFLHFNDTSMLTSRHGGTNVTEMFQSDFPGPVKLEQISHVT